MLKNLLQNQQNLKARGIYSCTGIYFFKSAEFVSALFLLRYRLQRFCYFAKKEGPEILTSSPSIAFQNLTISLDTILTSLYNIKYLFGGYSYPQRPFDVGSVKRFFNLQIISPLSDL